MASTAAFEDTFKTLTKYLVADAKERIGDKADRLESLLEYTTLGGKMTRGRTVEAVVKAYLDFQKEDENPTKRARANPKEEDDPLFIARVLGWGVELLQAYFLVEDDIMDQSTTRRGKACWYKREDVGLAMAVNDGLILRSCILRAWKRYVSMQPYYGSVLELLNESCWLTELGQMLDVMSEHTVAQDAQSADPFRSFKYDTWRNIVEHKTCYYTFYLPIALGLTVVGALNTLNGISEEDLRRNCLLIGTYFQAKDDELDCYGDPQTIGKIGTDIQECKATWLATKFFEIATEPQKKIFQENYGQTDESKVQAIKNLYEEVNVRAEFAKYEEEVRKEMEAILEELKNKLPWYYSSFHALWKKTYKRVK